MVKWVASTPDVTHDKLNEWIQSQYGAKEATATSYARVVFTFGALEVKPGQDFVTVTSLGRKVLEAEGQSKARVVVERFLQDYLGFREVLAVYNRSEDAIHIKQMVERLQPYFPRWTTAAQYEYRALWLLSLGCLHQEHGRYYSITEFGKELADLYPPIRDIDAEPPPTKGKVEPDDIKAVAGIEEELDIADRLTQELAEAAIDSQNPQRLEQSVAEAFEFLGFSVDHLGASGETDVVVRANIGEDSYVVVIDAKARSGGKVEDLNVFTLLDHRKENQADHAVVVAGDFASGKVASHAADNGVLLLTVPLFGQWLSLHAQTPLNLAEYKTIFASAGLLKELPDAVELAAENRKKWGQLLVDLTELIRETYYEQGLLEPLPKDMMFYMLATRLGGVRYSKKEVQQAVDFLTHPAVDAMLADDDGVSLVMDRPTLARALRALADRIETVETETQE
jgi:hypothetical protein